MTTPKAFDRQAHEFCDDFDKQTGTSVTKFMAMVAAAHWAREYTLKERDAEVEELKQNLQSALSDARGSIGWTMRGGDPVDMNAKSCWPPLETQLAEARGQIEKLEAETSKALLNLADMRRRSSEFREALWSIAHKTPGRPPMDRDTAIKIARAALEPRDE